MPSKFKTWKEYAEAAGKQFNARIDSIHLGIRSGEPSAASDVSTEAERSLFISRVRGAASKAWSDLERDAIAKHGDSQAVRDLLATKKGYISETLRDLEQRSFDRANQPLEEQDSSEREGVRNDILAHIHGVWQDIENADSYIDRFKVGTARGIDLNDAWSFVRSVAGRSPSNLSEDESSLLASMQSDDRWAKVRFDEPSQNWEINTPSEDLVGAHFRLSEDGGLQLTDNETKNPTSPMAIADRRKSEGGEAGMAFGGEVDDDPTKHAAPGERDKIPAKLEPGEVVIPKEQVAAMRSLLTTHSADLPGSGVAGTPNGVGQKIAKGPSGGVGIVKSLGDVLHMATGGEVPDESGNKTEIAPFPSVYLDLGRFDHTRIHGAFGQTELGTPQTHSTIVGDNRRITDSAKDITPQTPIAIELQETKTRHEHQTTTTAGKTNEQGFAGQVATEKSVTSSADGIAKSPSTFVSSVSPNIRAALREIGYTDEGIDKLSPKDTDEHLQGIAKSPSGSMASISPDVRAALREVGYTDEGIDKLSPLEAKQELMYWDAALPPEQPSVGIAKSPNTSLLLAGEVSDRGNISPGQGDEDWSLTTESDKETQTIASAPTSSSGLVESLGTEAAVSQSGQSAALTTASSQGSIGASPQGAKSQATALPIALPAPKEKKKRGLRKSPNDRFLNNLAGAGIDVVLGRLGLPGNMGGVLSRELKSSLLGNQRAGGQGRQKGLSGLLGGSAGGLGDVLGGLFGGESGESGTGEGKQELIDAIHKLTDAVNKLSEKMGTQQTSPGPQADGSFIPSLGSAAGQTKLPGDQGKSGDSRDSSKDMLMNLAMTMGRAAIASGS